MKKLILILLLTGLGFDMLTSCKKEEDPTLRSQMTQSNSINKILPLGASRVEGARPEYESFRYELWKDLVQNNWTFDFIGTQSDNASYPYYSNKTFDTDHEGRGGWTSGDILGDLSEWLKISGSPDIVLFSSPGGNDGLNGLPFENAVNNINMIIDVLQANNPNVTIIIEQMAPGRSDIMTPELQNFFNNMQQEVLNIASNQTTSTSHVLTIDMFTGFNDSYLADDVHYNTEGAEFIADRYYDALKDLLE